jgi:PAS domain S-box-containing protein
MDEPLRILCLEDVPADAEMNERALRSEGFTFTSQHVVTRQGFLDAIGDFTPDVILVDLSLPGFDGLDAVRLVRERAPHVPTIVVTGSIDEETAVECMKCGAADYIRKEALHRLGPALRLVLENKRLEERAQTARQRQQESEERFFYMALAAPTAIVTIDASGTVLSWNPAAAAMFGRSEVEMLGQSVTVIIPERYREAHTAAMLAHASIDHGRVIGSTRELEGLRKDGSAFCIALSLCSWPTSTGPHFAAFIGNIAEREEAEKALVDSEAKCRTLYESSHDAIMLLAESGFFDCNPAPLSVFNVSTKEELCAQSPVDLSPATQADGRDSMTAADRLATTMREGHCRFEWVHLRRDTKEKFPAEASLTAMELGGKRVLQASVRDITARKQVEEALVASEAKHRSMVHNAIYGIYRSTPDEMFVAVNPALVRMLGYDSEAEVLALSADDIYVEAGERADIFAGLGSRSNFQGLELHWKRRDGETILVRVSGQLLPHPEEGPLVLEIIAEDITRVRETERTRDQLAAAAQQTSDLVIITDRDGTIEYVNPAFERVTGYSLEEVKGQNPRLLKSGKHSAEHYEAMWKELGEGRPWTAEFVNRKKDGSEFYQRSRIYPIADSRRRTVSYVGISTDITHEMRMEEQLRQAQKMEAVGQLTAGVAHDFNNVLSVIGVNAELALVDCAAGVVPATDLLRAIEDSVRRAARITGQLLGFSRQARLTIEPADLTGVVSGLSEVLRTSVPENIQLGLATNAPVNTVNVDAAAVQQIVLNLVTNARDAMPNGGALDIAVRGCELDETYCETHPYVVPGAYVAIEVTDTGVGMDAKTRSKIFEPFFTTKTLGAGTGLGMAMVYGLTKQQGGHLHVYSELGVGTTITVLFPVSGEVLRLPIETRSEPRATTGTETILFVEDDEAICASAVRALEMHGYTVLTAVDGEDGLTTYRANAAMIDLVISDLVMPKMGGMLLVQSLRRESEGLRIILTSGYSEQSATGLDHVDESLAFLQKPWVLGTMLRKVREVLDRESEA